MKEKKRIPLLTVVAIIIFVVASLGTAYCIYNGLGRVPGINFGPGQYYYTDIPNWKDYFLVDYYHTNIPTIVFIILFFAWGLFMYKVWTWLDTNIK